MRAEARVITAREAVDLIPDGATVACGGFVGAGHPEALSGALEARFLKTSLPRGITLIYAAGQGDGAARGLNHLAHEGLLKRVIGGHWNLAPGLGRLAHANKIEAYNFPQGVISILFREIAGKRPGVFTKVGIGTFIDPRQNGGRMNARTQEELVELVQLGGEEWLWYRSMPINVCLIRATSADSRGNLALEREGIIGEMLPMAQAAHNHGGIVIAQVERLVDCIADPKAVRVPGILVDYVVVSEPQDHAQTFGVQFNPDFVRSSLELDGMDTMPFSERKIIGRRALREIRRGEVVNLGIGLPEAVAAVAHEERRLNEFTLTVESGPIGGVPASGLSFGCSYCPEAVLDQPAQFDFYDGGGLDIAVLGAVEIDELGNVNVSSFAGRFAGVGGFVNIAQSAARVVFCCTFKAGGLQVQAHQEQLTITTEGKHQKFVRRVAQICFNGQQALKNGQEVLYVTERAVFKLTAHGLELVEVAPGVDINTHILNNMDFVPLVNRPITMPAFCFANL